MRCELGAGGPGSVTLTTYELFKASNDMSVMRNFMGSTGVKSGSVSAKAQLSSPPPPPPEPSSVPGICELPTDLEVLFFLHAVADNIKMQLVRPTKSLSNLLSFGIGFLRISP